MFGLQKPKADLLMKTALLMPLFIGFCSFAIWLAAEPLCWHCFKHAQVSAWDKNFQVTELWCYDCGLHFKPNLNLHRPAPLNPCYCLTVYY